MTENNNEEEIDYSAYAYNRNKKSKSNDGNSSENYDRFNDSGNNYSEYAEHSGFDGKTSNDSRAGRYDNRSRSESRSGRHESRSSYDGGSIRHGNRTKDDYIDIAGEIVDERSIARVGSLSADIPRITAISVNDPVDISSKITNSMSIISRSIAKLELPSVKSSAASSGNTYNDGGYNYNRDNSGQVKKSKRGKRSGKSNFAIAMLMMIVCFGLVVVIADALSGGYIIDKTVGLFTGKVVTETYYAVELASFDDANSARLTSSEVRAAGAGGYVINDQIYRVIAEVYSSKNDALSVSAKLNLNGYVTSIYEISIGDINYGLFPTSTRKSTRDTIKYADVLYDGLFSIALNIDSGKYDFVAAKSKAKELRDRINNMLVDYEAMADEDIDNEHVHKVRMQLSAVIGALDNISTESTSAKDMLSDVRYVNCMVLNTHRALVEGLSGKKSV